MSSDPTFCEHANEVPAVCPCEPDCYCKSHTCKSAISHVPSDRVDWNLIEAVFHRAWGNASAGNYDKDVWKQLQTLLQLARREAGSMPDEGVLELMSSRLTRTGFVFEVRLRKRTSYPPTGSGVG